MWQKLGRVYRKIIVPIVAEKSDLIITVSNFAKKDIINEFSLSEDKVKVIYLGTSKIFSNVEFKDRYKNKKIGITITGKDPQKNIINLLESLNVIFKKKLLDEFIVIGIKEDEYKQFIHKNHRSKIKILEFASQECIKTLLLESWVFILASHYESFGIPAVEAMKCSLPVISSNKGALPEITGMESMSFNPNKLSTDLPVKLEKLSDINFYNKIARKSWARGEDFSYESTAKTTLDFYKNILEGI